MYAPNERHAREMFFLKIKELIGNKAQGMKIYGCNMNETLQQIDRISSNNIYKQLVQSLLNMINDPSFVTYGE